jgi:DNA invertase Pin-like site-specific DNA recombinase
MNGSNRIRLVKQRATDRQVQTEAVATSAAGYIRVSTEEQASTGHGLEIQDRAIRSFAESQGYRLIDVVSDPGVSGAKRPEDRPGFQKVIELAKARKFSVLLVWKFDRLARNLLFSVTSVHDLREQYAVVLRSVTEPIDTATPMGAMIFAILASFAAEERRVITGRTVAGKKEKASRGGFAGGAAPLGYKRDLKGGLLIDEEESAIVRRVVDMRQSGCSLQAIATALNETGSLPKRGKKFYSSTIRYLLDNPKYRGLSEYYFRHDGAMHCLTEGSHDPILHNAA